MCGSRGDSQPRDRAGQDAEAARALVLVGGLEQQLHAEADAEQRHAGGGALDQHARRGRCARGCASPPGTRPRRAG